MKEITEGAPQAKTTPPYLSPVTFHNFVETHRRTLPTRIDRSLMTNLSGTDQPKILSALRFFDLINDEGYTQLDFAALRDIEDEDALKAAWAPLLRNAYPYLFEGFDLANATQGQIEERFRDQGIKGDTVRKSVAFFVAMARNAGIALSPYIKATRLRVTVTGSTKERRNPRPASTPRTAPRDLVKPADQGAPAYTVAFKSGGTATLNVNVNPVALTREDREWLYKWVDSMKSYDSGSPDPLESEEPS